MAPGNKTFGKPKEDENAFTIEMPNESGVIIPDDTYEARVTDFSAAVAKSSGSKMWVVDVVIIKGKHAGTDFRIYLSHSAAASWKMAETLRALGFQQKTGEQVKFTRSDIVGRQLLIEVEVGEDQNGVDRSQVKKSLPHPKGPMAAGGLKSAPPVVEEEEDEEEAKPVKKAPAKKAAKKAPEPEPEEEEEEDDLDDALDEDDDFEEDDDDFEDDEDDEEEDDEEEDDEEEDDEEEDDEEEEPVKKVPAKKVAAKKAAPPPAKTAPPAKKKAR